MSPTPTSTSAGAVADRPPAAGGAASGTISNIKAAAALRAIAGTWLALLPSGEVLVELAEDGRATLNGLRVGSQHDVAASLGASAGQLILRRGDGWAVDVSASRAGHLVWTRPGEGASIEWVRTCSRRGPRPPCAKAEGTSAGGKEEGGGRSSAASTRSSEGPAPPPGGGAAGAAAEAAAGPAMSEPSPAASEDEASCEGPGPAPQALAGAEAAAAALRAVAGAWISAEPTGRVRVEVAEDGGVSAGGRPLGSQYGLLVTLEAAPSASTPVIRRRDGWAVDMKASKAGRLLWRNAAGEEIEWLRAPEAPLLGASSAQTEDVSCSLFFFFRACAGGR